MTCGKGMGPGSLCACWSFCALLTRPEGGGVRPIIHFKRWVSLAPYSSLRSFALSTPYKKRDAVYLKVHMRRCALSHTDTICLFRLSLSVNVTLLGKWPVYFDAMAFFWPLLPLSLTLTSCPHLSIDTFKMYTEPRLSHRETLPWDQGSERRKRTTVVDTKRRPCRRRPTPFDAVLYSIQIETPPSR